MYPLWFLHNQPSQKLLPCLQMTAVDLGYHESLGWSVTWWQSNQVVCDQKSTNPSSTNAEMFSGRIRRWESQGIFLPFYQLKVVSVVHHSCHRWRVPSMMLCMSAVMFSAIICHRRWGESSRALWNRVKDFLSTNKGDTGIYPLIWCHWERRCSQAGMRLRKDKPNDTHEHTKVQNTCRTSYPHWSTHILPFHIPFLSSSPMDDPSHTHAMCVIHALPFTDSPLMTPSMYLSMDKFGSCAWHAVAQQLQPQHKLANQLHCDQ